MATAPGMSDAGTAFIAQSDGGGTEAGLRIRSEIDRGVYPLGVVITDEQMAQIHLEPHAFHGDWNYTIRPRVRKH